ncbi:hypothetical protein BBP40_004616 [Aspergillus hancockii]|nr:hypothetical protein BBP40_004616 [Aspergillus hancockii]
MVREVEYRRCHVCWERGHIAVNCPIRDSLVYLASLAADLNNRIRRPAPIRVYRVNTARSCYGPPRRRRLDLAPRAHDRERHRVREPHDLPSRPGPVGREPGYANHCDHRDHHNVHDLRDHPTAGERNDIRLTPLIDSAHWQSSVLCKNDDHNNRSLPESAFVTDTKMDSQPGISNEQLVSSESDYIPLDIEIPTSDAVAASTPGG